MKIHTIGLTLIGFLLAGCASRKPRESIINLEEPFSVSIYSTRGESIPTEEVELKEILSFWLPQMKVEPYTFPTPSARMMIKGETKEGHASNMTVFVGQHWIGDGIGVVTLPSAQASRLWKIINKTGINQSR